MHRLLRTRPGTSTRARAQGSARRPGGHSSHERILNLQRSAGNAAVARLLQRQEAPQEEPGEQGGSPPDVRGEPVNKEQLTEKHDAPEAPAGGFRGLGEHAPVRVRAFLTLDSSSGPAPSGGPVPGASKTDRATGTFGFEKSVTRGGAAAPFGEEWVNYSIDNISWKSEKRGISPLRWNVVNIAARLKVDTTWEVNSGGNKDVPSGTAPVVNKKMWRFVRRDLRPDGWGRTRRKRYWAKDITEKHERYHAWDDIYRAAQYVPTLNAWLGKQDVAPNDAAVSALLSTARDRVEADGWAYYDSSLDPPAGERRAYADGKPRYQARVDEIDAQAKSNGWTT